MSQKSLRHLLYRILTTLKNKVVSLTFYEKLSLTISLSGAISLIFIYIQSAQTTQSMQASMYATIASHTLEMDKIFIEHPELRSYFYGGQQITEEDRNYSLVLSIAEYQLDYFDATTTQLGYIPDDADKLEDRETWQHYFADSFAKSPILCKRLNANRDWYMESLTSIADEKCNKSSERE